MLDLTPDEVLSTTRSVRKRLDFDKPVERQTLQECLEIAFQAPNGSNMNTWRWVLVDDKAIIEKMAGIYNNAMDDYIAMLGDAVGEDYMGASTPGFEKINQSVDYLRDNMRRAPAILIPLLNGRVENAGVFMQASSYGSILQAVWSFFLALRARGMGSAWTTAHLWREQELAELLNIPFNEYTQVGMFPIAYTLGTEFKKAYRKPFDEVVSWNTFS
jgi:nitroreductase